MWDRIKNIKSVHMPDTVNVIDKAAFSGLVKLQSIVIPDDVKVLETEVFDACKSLQSVTLPMSLESSIDATQFMFYRTFSECKNISRIKISYEADDYCTSDSVRIISSVMIVKSLAFLTSRTSCIYIGQKVCKLKPDSLSGKDTCITRGIQALL